MRGTIKRWTWRALVAALSLVAFAVVASLIARAVVQARLENDLAIATPNGIDDALFVAVNGTEHWITLRGHDRRNPVLFMIHGGPGGGNGPLAPMLRAYEERYTVVQWDQPGAGRTFRRAGHTIPPNVSLDSIAADGVALAEVLRTRLETDQLIVLGWSWGTAVGIEMIRKRPDLFAAYIGTGQLVAIPATEAWAYDHVLRVAREIGDGDAVAELEGIGAPPYDSIAELEAERRLAARLTGGASLTQQLAALVFAPRYSLADVLAYVRGALASQDHFMRDDLRGPMMTLDLTAGGTAFEVPVVFVQGDNDVVTPGALAREFFDRLAAPYKAYVPIEGTHAALVENVDAFLAALDMHVQPLLRPNE